MELKDYYAIMGVKPTDDLKTIKTAYRRLARKYHPDVSKEPDAEARFKEVAEAWEVLSDEQRRAEYDQMWQHRNDPQFNRQFHHGDGQSFNAEDFDDIFSSIFGQHARQSRQRPAARGHDIEIEVAVFLEETLTEHKRTISYNLPVYNAFGMIEQEIPKTLNVKIPAGVGNGQRIRLKGQGTPAKTVVQMAICGWCFILRHIRCSILSARIWKLWCRLARGKRRWVLKSPFQH